MDVSGMKTGNYYYDYVNGLRTVPEFEGITNADLHYRFDADFDALSQNESGGRTLGLFRIGKGTLIVYQLPAFRLDRKEFVKRTSVRRAQYTTGRLLANMGAEFSGRFLSMLNEKSVGNTLNLSGVWSGIEDPQHKGNSVTGTPPEMGNSKKWRSVKVPGAFDRQFHDLSNYNGWFWYVRTFQTNSAFENSNLTLTIGIVDDESFVWLDGKFLGEVSSRTHKKCWEVMRTYQLPKGTLKAGQHTLVVLCNDLGGQGGIISQVSLAREDGSLYADTPVAEDDPYRYYHW
jgi:hypothetical protein